MESQARYWELPSWRKEFKCAWKKAAKTPIMLPLNDKYRPDAHTWICTCLDFRKSRFLICKHLVQSCHPVPPLFFLQVQHNRTTPFWKHKKLVPLVTGKHVTASISEQKSVEGETETNNSDCGHIRKMPLGSSSPLRYVAINSATFAMWHWATAPRLWRSHCSWRGWQ